MENPRIRDALLGVGKPKNRSKIVQAHIKAGARRRKSLLRRFLDAVDRAGAATGLASYLPRNRPGARSASPPLPCDRVELQAWDMLFAAPFLVYLFCSLACYIVGAGYRRAVSAPRTLVILAGAAISHLYGLRLPSRPESFARRLYASRSVEIAEDSAASIVTVTTVAAMAAPAAIAPEPRARALRTAPQPRPLRAKARAARVQHAATNERAAANPASAAAASASSSAAASASASGDEHASGDEQSENASMKRNSYDGGSDSDAPSCASEEIIDQARNSALISAREMATIARANIFNKFVFRLLQDLSCIRAFTVLSVETCLEHERLLDRVIIQALSGLFALSSENRVLTAALLRRCLRRIRAMEMERDAIGAYRIELYGPNSDPNDPYSDESDAEYEDQPEEAQVVQPPAPLPTAPPRAVRPLQEVARAAQPPSFSDRPHLAMAMQLQQEALAPEPCAEPLITSTEVCASGPAPLPFGPVAALPLEPAAQSTESCDNRDSRRLSYHILSHESLVSDAELMQGPSFGDEAAPEDCGSPSAWMSYPHFGRVDENDGLSQWGEETAPKLTLDTVELELAVLPSARLKPADPILAAIQPSADPAAASLSFLTGSSVPGLRDEPPAYLEHGSVSAPAQVTWAPSAQDLDCVVAQIEVVSAAAVKLRLHILESVPLMLSVVEIERPMFKPIKSKNAWRVKPGLTRSLSCSSMIDPIGTDLVRLILI